MAGQMRTLLSPLLITEMTNAVYFHMLALLSISPSLTPTTLPPHKVASYFAHILQREHSGSRRSGH